jgi:hypothetical protein
MTAKRWLLFLLSIFIGTGLGLYYGWVLSPVEYVDTTPATLRADYRADYTLMVAETFQSEQDAGAAARRLAVLGSNSPATLATSALDYARLNGYAPTDLQLLQNLALALQVWQPAPAGNAAGTTPSAQPTGTRP